MYSSFVLTGLHYGTGRHEEDLKEADFLEATRVHSFLHNPISKSQNLQFPKVLVFLRVGLRPRHDHNQNIDRALLPPNNHHLLAKNCPQMCHVDSHTLWLRIFLVCGYAMLANSIYLAAICCKFTPLYYWSDRELSAEGNCVGRHLFA